MKNKIKVAMVATPFGDTGGPEVVVQNLTDALLDIGVEVTLFAPGDFKTKARHVHTLPVSLWNMKGFKNQSAQERRGLIISSTMEVLKYENEFDVVHLNSQRYAHLVREKSQKPCILTFHNKITKDEFDLIKNVGIHTVALSESHTNEMEVSDIINNGIPVRKIKPSFKKGGYFVAIGRLAESKGIDIAIDIAKKAGKKLYIFGRIGNSNERQEYFNKKIKPFLNNDIIFKGEVSQSEIFDYLKGAAALLSPIKNKIKVCPLTVMESLACGTPVIGTAIHPMPELLDDPSIACWSSNLETLLDAVKNIERFDRKKARKIAEECFDSSIMAKKYLELYKKVISENNHN